MHINVSWIQYARGWKRLQPGFYGLTTLGRLCLIKNPTCPKIWIFFKIKLGGLLIQLNKLRPICMVELSFSFL